METLLAWLCAIGAGALILAGITSIWSWANQFFNWKFSPARYQAKLAEIRESNAKNPKVEIREPKQPKWRRARAQQIAVLRHGYPWGLLVLGAIGYLVYSGFDLTFYAGCSIGWFMLTRMRFRQVVKATAKLNGKLHKDKTVPGHKLFEHTAKELRQHHYSWAFSEPSFIGEPKKRSKKVYWYYGPVIFRYPVNWICTATMAIVHFGWLRKLFHLRLVQPLVVYGALSLIWPLYAAVNVIVNVDEIMDEAHDRSEPTYRVWWAWLTPEPMKPKERARAAARDAEHKLALAKQNDGDEGDLSDNTTGDPELHDGPIVEVTTKTGDGYTYGPGNSQANVGNG